MTQRDQEAFSHESEPWDDTPAEDRPVYTPTTRRAWTASIVLTLMAIASLALIVHSMGGN
jgi:hypothetical protein